MSGYHTKNLFDRKNFWSKYSGNTEVDEFVRKLLPKLDHIMKLTKLNVEDFKANYKKRMMKDSEQNRPSWRWEIMFKLKRNGEK